VSGALDQGIAAIQKPICGPVKINTGMGATIFICEKTITFVHDEYFSGASAGLQAKSTRAVFRNRVRSADTDRFISGKLVHLLSMFVDMNRLTSVQFEKYH